MEIEIWEREGVGKGEQKHLQIGPITCPLKRPQDVIFIFLHCTNTFFSFTSSSSSSTSCLIFLLPLLPIPISSHHVRGNAQRISLIVKGCGCCLWSSPSAAAGAGPSQPLRIAEAPRLEHLRTVPEEPDTPSFTFPVQLQPRAGVPSLPRPIWKNEGPSPRLHLLRAARSAGAMHLSSQTGMGESGCAHRTA